MSEKTPARPVALHYRSTWLPRPQTFIYELIRHHERYAPEIACHEIRNEAAFPFDGPVHLLRGATGPFGQWLARSVLLRTPWRRRALRALFRDVRPALVHAHFGHDGVAAAGAAEREGIPAVVTFYGSDATVLPRHALWRRRLRALFGRVRLVLAEGPHLRSRLVELGCPEERTRVQPIPVRLDFFPFRPRTRPAEGPVVLLQACRFVEKKGVDLTVRAFAAVADDRPGTELWLLGDGPERSRIETLVEESGVASRIRLLGMRSHAEYAEILARSHVFVQPSRTSANGDGEGGAPTSLLEAQASGMVVVASDHADIPFVVAPDAGVLTPEGDVEALAGALRHVLDHPEEWGPRAEAGRRRVAERHDPRALARKLEAIYDEALGVGEGP